MVEKSVGYNLHTAPHHRGLCKTGASLIRQREAPVLHIFGGLAFQCGFHSCLDNCQRAFIAVVEHTGKTFNLGIFGRLRGVENQVRRYVQRVYQLVEDVVARLLALVLYPI